MKQLLVLSVLLFTLTSNAQADFGNVFAAGVDDAEKFTTDYLAPLSESAVYSFSNGWYNTGVAKPQGGFEISIIGNITSHKDKEEKQTFILDPATYENLDFSTDTGVAKPVSSALGAIEGTTVFVEGEIAGFTVREEFELPAGLAAEDLDFLPSGFLQASVGVLNGTEIKARFLPKLEYEDAAIGLIGFGVQQDLTKLLFSEKEMPFAISAVVGYTTVNGEYDLTNASLLEGDNQRIDMEISTWAFNGVVATNWKIINFYGGIGYITGTSTTDLLGEYRVTRGPFSTETYVDPFSITEKVSGTVGTIGAKLKLGFFRLHADYNIAEFNTLSAGVNFGFR